MNRKRQFDAIVFGDGPAGTTVARCLAALGHSVCIAQREQRTASPNARWETLSSGALELLRLHHEEAWPAIERLVIPCRATVLWTRDDARKPAVHRGMLVDRRGLDLILRASATAVGAVATPELFAGSFQERFAYCLKHHCAGRHSCRSRGARRFRHHACG